MDKSGCKKIIAHLLGTKEDGSDVIGVYPLLSNGTCRFIVFDFDNHEKGAEVTDFANTDNEWHKEAAITGFGFFILNCPTTVVSFTSR